MKNFGDIFTKIWKLQTPIPRGENTKTRKNLKSKTRPWPQPRLLLPDYITKYLVIDTMRLNFSFSISKVLKDSKHYKGKCPLPTSLLLKNHPLWRIFYYFQTCLTKRSSATPSLVPSNNGPAYNSLSFLLTLDYHRSFFGNHCNWSRILISRIQLVDFHKF